tara:strand:- start:1513 stop:1884 length:372 start_codon:yes stop_codon:yes gene_type:complete
MIRIIQNLFLASYYSLDTNVKNPFIINCTSEIPMVLENGIRIDIKDVLDKKEIYIENIHYYLNIIEEKLNNFCNVIIYSLRGKHRSLYLISKYLMIKEEYSYEDVVDTLYNRKNNSVNELNLH